MPAYDPKRPRPAASDDQGPAPVEALLEPVEADTEPATVAESTPPPSSAPTTAASADGAEPEAPPEEAPEQRVDEGPDGGADGGPDESEDRGPDAPAAADAGSGLVASEVRRDAEDVEVDLRDVSSNGSGGTPHEVPVAPAPNEVTTNRAVLVAGISAAALIALVVAVLLRRRRRTD
jgi:hypothetical protein